MQSLFKRVLGNKAEVKKEEEPTTTDFKKAASVDSLFPTVDPSVDGEECLHDCATCTIRYPAKFDVDEKDKLYGNVDAWSTHLLVATGKTDWTRDVADEEGSLMEAVGKGGIDPDNGVCFSFFVSCTLLNIDIISHKTLKLSASNMPVPDEYHEHEAGKQPTTVLLLPGFTIIDHVTPQLVGDLIRYFVDRAPTSTTPLHEQEANNPEEDITSLTSLRPRPCGHSAVILLCSQRTRDARCGQSAPLLEREFKRHLRPLGLCRDLDDNRPGGVGIYFISHVGGHKYAANVIVYRRRDIGAKDDDEKEEGAAQCIWLARVRPEDCENIVRYTVLKGKVVKPKRQLRGGFDRCRGLVSW